MEDAKIQWHPGFVAAMGMELRQDMEALDFKSEYNLNKKPLEIDLLVIKKEHGRELRNEIGKIFMEHNIMEYKSPGDSLDIDTFYKVTGYACLYKSYGKTADGIKAGDVTVSLVREQKPEKLFRYLEENSARIKMPYKGIYYINGLTMFKTQVIVTKELEKSTHMWLRALTDKMEKTDMENLMEEACSICGKHERELVESILEVTLNANSALIEEMRGDARMGEMMLKIMQPVILELERKAETKGKKAGLEEGKKAGLEEGKIIGSIEILRSFNSDTEIKKIIMEKYHLTEHDAEKYLKL